MEKKYASRKFTLSVLLVLLSTFLRFKGMLSDDAYMGIIQTIIWAYMIGNVGAKVAESGLFNKVPPVANSGM